MYRRQKYALWHEWYFQLVDIKGTLSYMNVINVKNLPNGFECKSVAGMTTLQWKYVKQILMTAWIIHCVHGELKEKH